MADYRFPPKSRKSIGRTLPVTQPPKPQGGHFVVPTFGQKAAKEAQERQGAYDDLHGKAPNLGGDEIAGAIYNALSWSERDFSAEKSELIAKALAAKVRNNMDLLSERSWAGSIEMAINNTIGWDAVPRVHVDVFKRRIKRAIQRTTPVEFPELSS